MKLLPKNLSFIPGALGIMSVSSSQFASAQVPQKPNIVIIYADDLGYGDASCYGATKLSTPNIDRVAIQGLRFTNAHCTSATSTPSRYSLLTGEYAWRKKGTGVATGDATAIIQPGRATIASIMKNDPWQINNLAINPKYRSKLKELRKAVQDRIPEINDVILMPEYQMSQRIAETKVTPYEFRTDQKNYPLKEIVATANLSGQGERVIKKQLKQLTHSNSNVRYWAAVGLDGQKDAIKPYKSIILASLNDTDPAVQIVVAGIAFKQFQDEQAKNILEKYTSEENGLLILQALQTIQYMRDAGKSFLPVLHQVKERFSKKVKEIDDNYNIVSITAATLHFLNGEALFFTEFEKWMPDSQLKEDKTVRFGNYP